MVNRPSSLFIVNVKNRLVQPGGPSDKTNIFKCDLFTTHNTVASESDVFVSGQVIQDWVGANDRAPHAYIASQVASNKRLNTSHATNQVQVADMMLQLRNHYHNKPTATDLSGEGARTPGSDVCHRMLVGNFTDTSVSLITDSKPSAVVLQRVLRVEPPASKRQVALDKLHYSLRLPAVKTWMSMDARRTRTMFEKPTGPVFHPEHKHIGFVPHGFVKARGGAEDDRALIMVLCTNTEAAKFKSVRADAINRVQLGINVTGVESCFLITCNMKKFHNDWVDNAVQADAVTVDEISWDLDWWDRYMLTFRFLFEKIAWFHNSILDDASVKECALALVNPVNPKRRRQASRTVTSGGRRRVKAK